MFYQDRIYGKIKIEEPVILELIKSPAIQRLKGIDQVGYKPLQDKLLKTGAKERKVKLSRFEHSLGVLILLRKFNASLGEQIAGLLHDVSHSVFSHCIDYTLDEGSEKNHDFQDKIHQSFVKNSGIPKILKKYGFNVNYLLQKENFPLLEKELPDLCADRIDYSLRTAIIYKEINLKTVDYFLINFFIWKDFWVFKNLQSAQKFAQLFLKLNRIYYSGFPSAVMFRVIGDILKYSLSKGYLKSEDLFTTDKDVIEKIKKRTTEDKNLRQLFKRMQGKVKFGNNPEDYDVSVFCKSRVVDPLCEIERKICRLSEINKNWAKIVKREQEPKKYFIKFGN
jgi:hypothetical protein